MDTEHRPTRSLKPPDTDFSKLFLLGSFWNHFSWCFSVFCRLLLLYSKWGSSFRVLSWAPGLLPVHSLPRWFLPLPFPCWWVPDSHLAKTFSLCSRFVPAVIYFTTHWDVSWASQTYYVWKRTLETHYQFLVISLNTTTICPGAQPRLWTCFDLSFSFHSTSSDSQVLEILPASKSQIHLLFISSAMSLAYTATISPRPLLRAPN